MTRLLAPQRTEDQQKLFDTIAGGPRSKGPQLFQLTDEDGALEGPFNAFLLQPGVGHALQALGAAIRYETTLGDRAREIAILVVAARWDSDFEWYAHEAIGRHVGLSADELKAVATRAYDRFSDPHEHCTAVTADLLAWTGDLTDTDYDRAVARLGQAQVFELTALVGYYATLALQLRTFRVALPQHATSTLASARSSASHIKDHS